MRWWAGIAFLVLLALAGLHSAATAGVGATYYLGLWIAVASGLLIFVFIGQRGHEMPDSFLPNTDVDRPGALVGMLVGFAILAGVGVALAVTSGARDLRLVGMLFVIAAVVSAARAVGRYIDRHGSNRHA